MSFNTHNVHTQPPGYMFADNEAALTQHKHAELVAGHLRGAYNDDVRGQTLLVVRALAERTE